MDADGFRIFLASPSGLEDYRRAAREVSEQVRLTVASRRSIGFDPIGWEDLRPGFGRAQGLINAELDGCNVLIGILGRQLGTPTGEAPSGFVEEYERMAARARDGEPVAIYIYLLELTAEELADPGDKLKAVLAFRERLFHDALVREVGRVSEFSLFLHRDLVALVLEADERRRERGESSTAPATLSASRSPEPEQQRVPVDEAGRQLKRLLNDAAASAPALAEDFLAGRVGVARLGLWLSAWEGLYYTSETYGVHPLNRLYTMRSQVALSPLEARHILRAMCAQPLGAPCWGLIGYEQERAFPELLVLASGDDQDTVRVGALGLLERSPLDAWLARADVDVDRAGLFEIFARDIGGQSDAVRSAIIAFAQRAGGTDARRFLSDLTARDETRRPALIALIRLLAEEDHAEMVALASGADVELDDATLTSVRETLDAAPVADLARLAAAPDRGLRIVAILALGARGDEAGGALAAHVEDADDAVAVAAFAALCESGAAAGELEGAYATLAARESLKFDSELRRARDRTLPTETLRGSLDWLDISSASAYRVLAEERWGEFRDTVRRDLRDSFDTFAALSRTRLTAGLGSEVVEALRTGGKQLVAVSAEGVTETVDSQVVRQLAKFLEGSAWNDRVFAEAALAGVALNGETEDAGLVRPFLESEHRELKEAAALALAGVGTAGDVAGLLELCRLHRSEVYARAALALSPGVSGAAVALLSSPHVEIARLAGRHLRARAGELSAESLMHLLHHSDGDVRRIAVACAVEVHDDAALAGLLERYTAAESYFYNVVVLLDRVLFAPDYLRERSRAELADFAAETRAEELRAGDGRRLRQLLRQRSSAAERAVRP